jgi:hypothetical protein
MLCLLAAGGAAPIMPLRLLASALKELGHEIPVVRVRDLIVAASGLLVRAHPGTFQECVGLIHRTLEQHLKASSQFDILGAHKAMLQVLGHVSPEDAPDFIRYPPVATAEHLWAVGRWADALEFVRDFLSDNAVDNLGILTPWFNRAQSALGGEDAETLRLGAAVAFWAMRSGDLVHARSLYAELLPKFTKVFGSNNHETLQLREESELCV